MKALTIGDSATIILGLQDEIRRTEESRVRGERPSRTARGGTVGAPETPEREAPSGNERRSSAKSGVVDPGTYDWEGDTQLKRPSSQTIVYEMHVRGFTRHPSSGIAENIRGTYRGLIEKISYLQQLGITAVELFPIFQFDAQDCQIGLVNYWGYAPVSFFAPHRAYSSRQDTLGPVDEFRDMVKALHRAGIEVILDVVVFNHTAEGDHSGPTLCFRGIDNHTYTSSNKIVRAMPTIAVLETHSILIIRSCAA